MDPQMNDPGMYVQAGYSPYSGASFGLATGAAAAPAAGGFTWSNPLMWLLAIAAVVVIIKSVRK